MQDVYEDLTAEEKEAITIIIERGLSAPYVEAQKLIIANVLAISGNLSPQDELLSWLDGGHRTIDESQENIAAYPVLYYLIGVYSRGDVVYDVVGRLSEKAYQSCGNDSTDFLKQFVSLYPTLGGHSDHVGEIHAIGSYFIPKVPPSRRDELSKHIENVLQEMDNYEDEPIEYLTMLVKQLKD